MSFNPNITNKDVAHLIFYNYNDKKPYMQFDRANATATGLTADRVWATGGQGGAKRVGFDSNPGGTLTVDTQITPMKLYEMLSGKPSTTSTIYPVREVLTGTTNSTDVIVSCTETPTEGSVYIYAIDDEGGTNMVGTATEREVKVVGGTAGTSYVVYYMVTTSNNVSNVTFTATNFPKAFIIYGDTWYKSEDDEIVAVKLTYYRATPQRNFTLSHANSGDPGTISIVFDLLPDDNDNIWSIAAYENE